MRKKEEDDFITKSNYNSTWNNERKRRRKTYIMRNLTFPQILFIYKFDFERIVCFAPHEHSKCNLDIYLLYFLIILIFYYYDLIVFIYLF